MRSRDEDNIPIKACHSAEGGSEPIGSILAWAKCKAAARRLSSSRGTRDDEGRERSMVSTAWRKVSSDVIAGYDCTAPSMYAIEMASFCTKSH